MNAIVVLIIVASAVWVYVTFAIITCFILFARRTLA
jgi:hypothetical protein